MLFFHGYRMILKSVLGHRVVAVELVFLNEVIMSDYVIGSSPFA